MTIGAEASPARRRLSDLFAILAVLAAYYLGGRVGLAVPFTNGNVSPVWPPSGIALASMLLCGRRTWPAVALGAFLVNVFTPIPHSAALGIAVGNTAGAFVGVSALRRVRGFATSLTRLRDVIWLVVFGAICGTAISATVGTLSLFVTGVKPWSSAAFSWLIWFLGDATGVLIVAPPILAARRLTAVAALDPGVVLETLVLIGGAVGGSALIFGGLLGLHVDYVLALALFPFVMWGAIRFEAAGAAMVTFLVSAIAVWDTAHRVGPFVRAAPLQNAMLLESFLTVVAVSGLSVAALISERTTLIREQAEREAVRLGEARYQGIADTANEGVWVLDEGLLTCFVNRRMAALLGYPVDRILGRPATDFMFEEDVARKEAELERRRQGVSEQVENRYRRSDGSELWVRVNTSASFDKNGRFTGALAMVSDITEQRRKEAAARRDSNAILLLSRALEQTADSVVITDRQGVIEYVNPAFEQTTGYDWDQAVGRTPAILKSGHHDGDFYASLWAQLLDGRSFRGTLVNRKRSGQLYWTEQTITPVTDDNGTITHFVSVLKDITELRRKHEQEVQMRLARDVQQQFYREPAAVPGLDIAAASYLADQTGGDYFDVIPAGPDAAYVAIGDASGHGLPSALVMALTRAYVRSLAAMQLDVADILTRLNTMLAQDLDESRFVTLLLGRVDACRSELSYANAGHVPGFILDGRDGVAATMPSTGPPLGFFPRAEFRGSRMPLAPHQLVLLVTDGVTESGVTTDHEFGAERAVAYARANCEQSARRIVEGLCQAAREFSPDATPADDITSMVVKVTGRA